MTMLRHIREDDRSRGAVLVEFALLTPLLLILVLGTIDFGRVLMTKIAVVEAVEEGAIYAAYNSTDYSGIQERVVASLDSPTIVTSQVVVTCPTGTTGTDIKVTVTHDMNLITPFISNFFGPTVTLTAEVTADKLGTDDCTASP